MILVVFSLLLRVICLRKIRKSLTALIGTGLCLLVPGVAGAGAAQVVGRVGAAQVSGQAGALQAPGQAVATLPSAAMRRLCCDAFLGTTIGEAASNPGHDCTELVTVPKRSHGAALLVTKRAGPAPPPFCATSISLCAMVSQAFPFCQIVQ